VFASLTVLLKAARRLRLQFLRMWERAEEPAAARQRFPSAFGLQMEAKHGGREAGQRSVARSALCLTPTAHAARGLTRQAGACCVGREVDLRGRRALWARGPTC
jgi:hypothetical protein